MSTMEKHPVQLIADGQPMEVHMPSLSVIVHPGEMEIEVPGHVLIDPETTVTTSNELEQDQWELIRVNENFLKVWKAIWKDVPPPEVLRKGNLAIRHTTGLILLMFKARGDGKPVFIKLPETYLHPKQQASLMTAIYIIQGRPR